MLLTSKVLHICKGLIPPLSSLSVVSEFHSLLPEIVSESCLSPTHSSYHKPLKPMSIMNLNDEQLDVIYGALGCVEGIDKDQDLIIHQLYEMIDKVQNEDFNL